jgi:uncharacterized repeat protein (TIGR04138 family)
VRKAVDPRILELSRESPHFAYEAYEFVCDAVSFTQRRLGRTPEDEDDEAEDHHVSGAELLRGVCDLAVMTFGMMAPVVFKRWNVRTTGDVGRMVFDLIRVGRLSKSDRDAPEDFHDLFDLPKELAGGFELTLDDRSGVKRGDR